MSVEDQDYGTQIAELSAELNAANEACKIFQHAAASFAQDRYALQNQLDAAKQQIAELRAWKEEASAVFAATHAARDAGMADADRSHCIGRGTDYIIADLWQRVRFGEVAEAKMAAAVDALLGLIPSHRNPADRCWCPLHVAVPHTPECLRAREVLAWIEAQTARASDTEPSRAETIRNYCADISGPLTLYVWHDKPPSRDSVTFHTEPCEGQWTVGAAKARAKEMVELGHSVWIENASGLVVFRANHGHVEFPLNQKRFWEGAGR